VIITFLLQLCLAHAEGPVDEREFRHAIHPGKPGKGSVHFTLKPERGEISKSVPIEIWPGLWLRALPLGHVKVKQGKFAYSFQFSADSSFDKILRPTDQPAHGITADVVAAFHFRNSDNSGPNEVGPKNVNAPQEIRQITYDGFRAEIRLLRFQIIGTRPGMLPSFIFLECLVRVEASDAR
jgi:hypothetical protein